MARHAPTDRLENAITTTQEALTRPPAPTNASTGIFTLLGLIDVALTGVIG
jgi:hypothetical protein